MSLVRDPLNDNVQPTCVDQLRAAFCCVTENGHSQATREDCEQNAEVGLLLAVTCVDVAVPDTPHLRFLAFPETLLVDIRSLCFPAFSENLLSNLPALLDRSFGVVDVEGVHNFVGGDEAEVLKDAVARQVVDQFPQSGEVPHQSPGFLVRYD